MGVNECSRWVCKCGYAQNKYWCRISMRAHTLTQPFNGLLSGTTRRLPEEKHSPTHTHPDDPTSFIIILHLQRSMASSLLSLRAWQSSRTTSLQVLFGLPLGLGREQSVHNSWFMSCVRKLENFWSEGQTTHYDHWYFVSSCARRPCPQAEEWRECWKSRPELHFFSHQH